MNRALSLVMILAVAAVVLAPSGKGEKRMTEKSAIFAGGCFWCMEGPFEAEPGVLSVRAGYTGGTTKNPSYEEVSTGSTGHVEAIKVIYDPAKVTYERLLEIYWHQIDPTDADGQFADQGTQYVTAIFYADLEQKKAAEKSKKALQDSGVFRGRIVTAIRPASEFYDAEEYHQDYYKKNPLQYYLYKKGSGREDFIHKYWPLNKDKKSPK